ncbi:MAG: hypothetical protein DRO11_03630 [Methanobacteriota archaeon]|nr:MAG: hypothetical protein DRO11_03630 [Euryarchaeota archaeon]
MSPVKIVWGTILVILAVIFTKLYLTPEILHQLVPQAPPETVRTYFQAKPGVWIRKIFLLTAILLYLLGVKNVVQAVRHQKNRKTG